MKRQSNNSRLWKLQLANQQSKFSFNFCSRKESLTKLRVLNSVDKCYSLIERKWCSNGSARIFWNVLRNWLILWNRVISRWRSLCIRRWAISRNSSSCIWRLASLISWWTVATVEMWTTWPWSNSLFRPSSTNLLFPQPNRSSNRTQEWFRSTLWLNISCKLADFKKWLDS